MVDTLLFVVNKQRQSRVSWGALKKAIMGFRATGPFTVDDLMVSNSLPIGVARKSLVSGLDSLCRRGFLRCVESSVRGRVGSPKVYVLSDVMSVAYSPLNKRRGLKT